VLRSTARAYPRERDGERQKVGKREGERELESEGKREPQ